MNPYFLSFEYALLGLLSGVVNWPHYMRALRDIADEENQ